MQSITLHGDSVESIESQIQSATNNDFQPTLAITFGSVECNLNQLTQMFNEKNIQVVGASSAGEFTEEGLVSHNIVVMLLDMKTEHFSIFQTSSDYANSFVAGKKLGIFGKEKFQNPAFMLLFTMSASGEGIIEGLRDELALKPKVFGAMAGDDMKMQETFTFTNNGFGNNLVTSLVIDNDAIEVEGLALCGWQPIGAENVITKAENNVIHTINNEPALSVVKKYFGEFFENTIEEDTVAMGAAQYPLQLKRGDDVVLRATLFANDDGSLNMGGPVNEGDRFRFSIAPGFEIIEETVEGFKDYYQKSAEKEADAVIIFSCKARHMSLGQLVRHEIKGIHEIWQKPVVGFFSYGEVGQNWSGSSHFYNETCSLMLIKEK